MLKRDYFLLAVNQGCYLNSDWIKDAFCGSDDLPRIEQATYHGQLVRGEEKDSVAFAEPNGEFFTAVPIDDIKIGEFFFNAKDDLLLKAGELPIVKQDIATGYGSVIANMCILYFPFKDKFEYTNKIFGGWFEEILVSRFEDNIVTYENVAGIMIPKIDHSKEQKDKIYVHEFIKYSEACGYLASLAPIFASSGSLKAMTVAPEVIKLRDELVEKHKSQLGDRTVQAQIEEQLVAADKASFKDDIDGKDFLISGKSFNPTRKKAQIMIGGSAGFGIGGTASFIPTSLKDKWKVEDIPVHANEARSGSFYRGKETQLGGTIVKSAYRMTFTAKVSYKFCGSENGQTAVISELNKNQYLGLYQVTPSGPVEITSSNVAALFNKLTFIHSPQFCKSDGSSYCHICLGKTYNRMEYGLPSVVANIGDVYMYDKMKRMHGKALNTFKVNMSLIMY